MPSVSCKNHHLSKAFYGCSQPALFLPCLAEQSHAVLPSVSCSWPQQRSTEPKFGDFSRRHAAFSMMLSPGPALTQQLTCLSSRPWSGDQDHQNIKAFCVLTSDKCCEILWESTKGCQVDGRMCCGCSAPSKQRAGQGRECCCKAVHRQGMVRSGHQHACGHHACAGISWLAHGTQQGGDQNDVNARPGRSAGEGSALACSEE